MKKTTQLMGRLTLLVCLIFSTANFAQTQTFDATSTFTVPAGVTTLQVQAWGGGGAGGGATGNPSAGGGGAGGGFVRNNAVAVIPGTTYTVTVGTGGIGNATSSPGSPGGASWFGSVTTLLAVGGNGGNRATSNNTTATGATALTTGNIGATAPFSYYGGGGGTGAALGVSGGGGGSSAGTNSNGNSGVGVNGGGAPTGGGGGVNGSTSSADGNDNNNLGGGGAGARSGSSTDRLGGNGGNGRIIISWVCPTYALTSTTLTPNSCANTSNTVTLAASASGLPTGVYTVTYNLSGANTSVGNTTTMTVTTAGTGTFATINLPNVGNTTLTVTNLSSGGTSPNNCSSNITSNNSGNTVVISTPAQPSIITGNTAPCVGASISYSVASVAGVSYAWTLPTGWTQTGGGTTNSITVTVGSGTGNITVTPSNSCGNGTARTLAVIPATVPAQPSTISGAASPCVGASLNYSVTNVSGTSYSWTLPAGWVQTGGGTTNAITVTASANAGNITVTPSNICGNGTARTFAVAPIPGPSQPSTIIGASSVCQGAAQNYEVINTPGITYNWTFPAGWTQTGGTTTNAITVLVGAGSGDITVTPASSCGNGPAQTLAVTSNATPTITSTTPGSRVGFGTVTLGATASSGTISWFANASGGAVLGTGTSFITPVIVTTTTYYVETTVGVCTSTPRTAVIATVNAPEIAVSGNGLDITDDDLTPEVTDFTNLGITNVAIPLTRTYTIQNVGQLNLTIGAFSITGANASEFVVTVFPAATIAPGASSNFSVRFIPTAVGVRNANLSFVTNDTNENPFNFNIRGVGGTGVNPEINIQGAGITIIDGDSGPQIADGTNFGTVVIPGSTTRTFTIQNTGTGPLTLSGPPYVILTGSPNFSLVAPFPSSTIAAGGSTTFSIQFTPTTTGSSIGLVTINNDDADESVYDFAIQGAATVATREIDIQGNEISIVDGDTTPSTADQTDFGITDTTTRIAIPYNVYNFGGTTLTLTTVVGITGVDAASFSATAVPASLAPGAVGSFVVTFTPSTLGIKTATISVLSNDADEATYNYNISVNVQTLAPLTTGPGGITANLKSWIKANSEIGSQADDTDIVVWEDQTIGSTKNATAKFSKEPKFKNNSADNINFNPVIRFNGTSEMSAGQGFNNGDMYIVMRPTNPITSATNAQDIYCGDDVATNRGNQDVTGFEMGNSTTRLVNELVAYNQGAETAYGIGEISTTKSYFGVNIFNPRKSAIGRMEMLCNGNLLTTTEALIGTYKDIVNSRYWLGRSEFFAGSYNGDILEVFNYSIRNNNADRAKIESYLAIKYGITLGINGVSQNYVDSSGNIIYAQGAGYNFNIAGIGRDDKSNLDQRQSKTENTNADITIGLGDIFSRNSDNTNAFPNDRNLLMWGSNNATLGAQAPILVNMSSGVAGLTTQVDFTSIGRTWKVVENGGDIPTVKVSVPSTLLTSTITPPGDFLMFISDSPIFSPTAEYKIMRFNGSKIETTYDFNGTKYITFGYAPERTFVRAIDFDGVNDYLDAGNVLNLDTAFTISAWIKRSGTDQSIVSKRNSAFTSGYDLSINSSGNVEMSWINGSKQTITSSVEIPTDKWHNIAVTYDGEDASLYIDGVLDVDEALDPPVNNNQSFIIAAADGLATTSFFDGTIDEVRVFSGALSQAELRYIMNQEILEHSNTINGSILPQSLPLNEVSDIAWTNLKAYYPMSTYTYTNAKDESNNDYTAALKNLTTVDYQTAPLPYRSAADGNWNIATTWTNSTVQNAPYSFSIIDGSTRIGWNIVQMSHDIQSTGSKVVLGMDIQSGELTASNDSKIEVSHYLNLNGKIDLEGMSQLVQTDGSFLTPTSTGSIEREQQGTKNIYNYNYWSSPVSTINGSSNNTGYAISDVFKDGTDPGNIQNINWISDYDGSASSPISLAEYWIYKFQNVDNDYANWSYIGSAGTLLPGEGFTLKGSGTASDSQNYAFQGKPNNGLITLPIGPGFLNLCGNPYASALDSQAFITDNLGSLDGTLYFWEHYGTNDTHTYADYQGGYAALTLTGGTPPVSPPGVSGLGSSTRTPKRFIPVGQGFFVTGNATGGNITFNNNQRLFVRETNPVSNVMFRAANTTTTPATPTAENNGDGNNEDDSAALIPDAFKKIRLGFNSANNYHRQILMGFMNQYATSGLDNGYDAVLFDDFPNDMYFMNGETRLVIQGESFFNENTSYPLGVKTGQDGDVQILVDDLINFEADQQVYIFDVETQLYHDITTEPFQINLPTGLYNNRFELRFVNQTLNTEDHTVKNDIKIVFTNSNNLLTIENIANDLAVTGVTLFNILGQNLQDWNVANESQTAIKIAVQNYAAGTYIVKVQTTNGTISKQILIK